MVCPWPALVTFAAACRIFGCLRMDASSCTYGMLPSAAGNNGRAYTMRKQLKQITRCRLAALNHVE